MPRLLTTRLSTPLHAALLAVSLLLTVIPGTASADSTPPAPLQFSSSEGLARLQRAEAKADFAALANQFEAQASITFCGPASAAIVLNALDPKGELAEFDQSRIQPADGKHLPKGLQLSFRRHTQESVLNKGAKTRPQLFGEPMPVGDKVLPDGGYQLRQFAQMLRANGASATLVIADAQVSDADIRRDITGNLNRAGDYVIVNYARSAVGQPGGGHISPLAAYDAGSDSVLVLDVNPAHQPWIWLPLPALIKAMRTRDMQENRGYVLVSRPAAAR